MSVDAWVESVPGGMLINNDPQHGGIIDKNIASGRWFVVIDSSDGVEVLEDFATRDDALEMFYTTIRNNGNNS